MKRSCKKQRTSAEYCEECSDRLYRCENCGNKVHRPREHVETGDGPGQRVYRCEPASRKPPAAARKYLAEIGAEGGQVGGKSKSAKKAAAARANGKKGGRPPTICGEPGMVAGELCVYPAGHKGSGHMPWPKKRRTRENIAALHRNMRGAL